MITAPIAKEIFDSKYRFNGESEEDFAKRIGGALSRTPEEAFIFSSLIYNHNFMPAGRILYGVGTDHKNVCFSNCFVLPIENDSMHSIMDASREAAITFKGGGGIGYNFTVLRPKDARIFTINGKSTGVISFMRIFDAVCGTIMLGGNRRGAQIGVLNCYHPEILDFIVAKRDGSLKNFNISVGVTDDFMQAVKKDTTWDLVFPDTQHPSYDTEWKGNLKTWKESGYPVVVYNTVRARELYDKIIESNYNFAEPGILFLDSINNMNNLSYCEYVQSTNPCLSADTYVVTNKGLAQISSVLGNEVTLYDGAKWVTVNNVMQTGDKEDLYRITFSDGSYVDATAYHTWYTENGQKVETRNIQIGTGMQWGGSVNMNCTGSTEGAYFKGFMLGAGTVTSGNAVLQIPDERSECIRRLLESLSEVELTAKNPKEKLSASGSFDTPGHTLIGGIIERGNIEMVKWCTSYRMSIPADVYMWSDTVRCNFLSGVFDAIGIAGENKTTIAYYIDHENWSLLIDIQRLLKTIGVYSKLVNMTDHFRLLISNKHASTFASKMSFEHLKMFDANNTTYETTQDFHKVVSIEKIPGKHKVYCCNIPSTGRFLLGNGVVTGNCGELPLAPHSACLLGSVNLSTHVQNPFSNESIFDFQKLTKSVYYATVLLNRVLDINKYPLDGQQLEAYNKRLIGLGITGLADMLAMMKLKYSSADGRKLVNEVMKNIRDTAYRSSIDLAREEGPFPLFDREKYLKSRFVKDLPPDIIESISESGIRNGRMISIAPCGTISLLMNNVSSGLEPIFSLEYNRRVKQADGAFLTSRVEDYGWSLYKEFVGNKDLGVEYAPDFFETAQTLNVNDHITMQALLQAHVDSSISKTINVPENYPVEEFSKIYWNAWELGLKGCTTYRPNDIVGSVLEIDKKPELSDDLEDEEKCITLTSPSADTISDPVFMNELKTLYKFMRSTFDGLSESDVGNDKFIMRFSDDVDTGFVNPIATIVTLLSNIDVDIQHEYVNDSVIAGSFERELLDDEPSIRHRVIWKDGSKVYVTVTRDEDGFPLEVFAKVPKEAGVNGDGLFNPRLFLEKSAYWDTICRLVSALLRHNIPLKEIISQLNKGSYIERDLPALLSNVLNSYPRSLDYAIMDEEGDMFDAADPKTVSGAITYLECPECGEKTYVREAGCYKCTSCLYSKCD